MRVVGQLGLSLVVALVACAKSTPPPAKPAPPPPVEEPTPQAPQTELEDGMKLSGQLGAIAEQDITQAFRARWADITRCTQQAQARQHYLTGTMELKFRVGKDGLPLRVFIERSTIGNYDVERCVLEIARVVTFPAPSGGPEAEFSFPIEVRPRASSPYVVAWDEARVAPSFEKNRKDVGICRGDPEPPPPHQRGRHPKRVTPPPKKIARVDLPPNIELTMYIAPGGRVASAGLAAPGPIDDTFATCLVGKAKAWKLDDPRGQFAKLTLGVKP